MSGALRLSEAHPVPPKCPWDPGSSDDHSSVLPRAVSHRAAAAEKQSKPQVVSIFQPPLRQEVPKPGNKNCFKELGKTKTKQPVVYRQPVGKWEMAELTGHILWAPQGLIVSVKKMYGNQEEFEIWVGKWSEMGGEWCWKCYWGSDEKSFGSLVVQECVLLNSTELDTKYKFYVMCVLLQFKKIDWATCPLWERLEVYPTGPWADQTPSYQDVQRRMAEFGFRTCLISGKLVLEGSVMVELA